MLKIVAKIPATFSRWFNETTFRHFITMKYLFYLCSIRIHVILLCFATLATVYYSNRAKKIPHLKEKCIVSVRACFFVVDVFFFFFSKTQWTYSHLFFPPSQSIPNKYLSPPISVRSNIYYVIGIFYVCLQWSDTGDRWHWQQNIAIIPARHSCFSTATRTFCSPVFILRFIFFCFFLSCFSFCIDSLALPRLFRPFEGVCLCDCVCVCEWCYASICIR